MSAQDDARVRKALDRMLDECTQMKETREAVAVIEAYDRLESRLDETELERDHYRFHFDQQEDRAEAAEALLAECREALKEARKQVELLEIMDMTATAKQWEGAAKYERERAEAIETQLEECKRAIGSALTNLGPNLEGWVGGGPSYVAGLLRDTLAKLNEAKPPDDFPTSGPGADDCPSLAGGDWGKAT